MTNHDTRTQPNLKCPFCQNGTYIKHEKNFFERIGVPTVDGMIYTLYGPELYICNNCNNIQLFAIRNPEKDR
jgi:hypothetical protein